MHFIDEAKIFIKSGNGGPGCVSFRREANVPMGGPDGGNGGRGGSVILKAVTGLNTLIDFRYQQHFKARSGEHGMGRNRSGASSDDLIINVPVGTQIFDEHDDELLIDLTHENQQIILAKGGDGGCGNAHYKSSVNQAPRRATPGWPGEERWVWLKLKLLSDAGLVGLPNAGKSTFLSRVTRAKPKIADYPFTTLQPQLGVTAVDGHEFVLADLPGLIEGAHEGVGLGIRFLKHIERCGVLLHLIDGTMSVKDIKAAYHTIRHELVSYGHQIEDKAEIIALNKMDALSEKERTKKQKALETITDVPVFLISAVSGEGTENVLRALYQHVLANRKQEEHAAAPPPPETPEPSDWSPV